MLPLSKRRRSRAESAEGGGATTDGAGRLSFELREVSRSGAETGGGTTAVSFICTRVGETSRLMAAGAGGITLALRAGVERAWSREMRVDAGRITLASKEGAAMVRSRETLGAGAMIVGSRDGATSACSDRTSGAGGTTAAFRAGAVRDLFEETLGAGAITLAGRLGAVREECRPSAGGGPGLALKASRLATAPMEDGSLRSGASTTLGASEPPRAT